MGDVKVSNSAPVQAASEVSKPQKAESALSKHLSGIKNALFGRTGASILAGAAAGALIGGGPVGAVIGGVAGLGLASGVKAAERGNKAMGVLNTAAAGALVGLSFGLPGLLVGGSAYLFASGAAQKGAEKIANFLKGNQPETAPAQ